MIYDRTVIVLDQVFDLAIGASDSLIRILDPLSLMRGLWSKESITRKVHDGRIEKMSLDLPSTFFFCLLDLASYSSR